MLLTIIILLCLIPVAAIAAMIAHGHKGNTGYNPEAYRNPRDDGAFDHGDEPL